MTKLLEHVPSLEVAAFLFPDRPFRYHNVLTTWFRARYENSQLVVETVWLDREAVWLKLADFEHLSFGIANRRLVWINPIEVSE